MSRKTRSAFAGLFALTIVLGLVAVGSGAALAQRGAAPLPRYGLIGYMGTSGSPGTVAASGAIGAADFNGDGLVDVVVVRALGGPPVGAQGTFPIGVLLNDGEDASSSDRVGSSRARCRATSGAGC